MSSHEPSVTSMTLLTPIEGCSVLDGNRQGSTVYLIGAGGCGMSGLGHLLLDLGYRIAGSDLIENESIRQLRARGATINNEHLAENLIAARPFLVVFSSAIEANNPELVAAWAAKIPIARRGVMLAALLRRQQGVCIAGMHGKTTTTALAAYALDQLHASPNYAVGALVPQLYPHARFTSDAPEPAPNSRRLFVVEADESDGTLRDFEPQHAIILNLDEEHLDHFANFENVIREFRHFAESVTGRLIYCADDPNLAKLCRDLPDAISYGRGADAHYRIALSSENRLGALHESSSADFSIYHRGEHLGDFSIGLIGEHNVSNAAAVIALLHQLQYSPGDIAKAIRTFHGAERRQQELYQDERCRVFDDYGHHPAEIRATLLALRNLAPSRLLVAFQPHRFTRTQQLQEQFSECFREADRLWLTEIYSASEPPIAGITGGALADAIRRRGQDVEFVASPVELGSSIRAAMEPGDLILFLGAGDITAAAHDFAEQMRKERLQIHKTWQLELAQELAPASVVRCDEALAKRTTLRVGGPADLYVEPSCEADLSRVLQFCAENNLRFFVLGRGSNLLVQDRGIRGVVICLAHSQFSRVEVRGEELHCGAGAKLKAVAVEAKRHGLSGLEFLEGIPGSVGGALRMNAGAMSSAMFEVVESVRLMDFSGQVFERGVNEVEVQYRNCPLFKDHIAIGAVLRGRGAPAEEIAAKMNACSKKRWSSQPAAPSAGCIFKNPHAIPAGRLIEELGLKGKRFGGAVISDVHGNFIVNEGRATAGDILHLIDLVKDRARSERGIELETEVQIVGGPAPCRAFLHAEPSVGQVPALH